MKMSTCKMTYFTFLMFLVFLFANVVVVNSSTSTLCANSGTRTSRKIPPTNLRPVEKYEPVAAYVDKTESALELIRSGGCFLFLRPRTFGKTFFVNTLQYILQGKRNLFIQYILRGKRNLFNNTYIGQSEYDWEEHLVLRLDFERYDPTKRFFRDLCSKAREHGVFKHQFLENTEVTALDYLEQLLRLLAKKGKPVAILIDDYDFPFRHSNDTTKNYFHKIVALLKTLTEERIVRFVFLTGIMLARHPELSTSPHIQDISLLPQYASLCGFTKDELKKYFYYFVQKKADKCQVTVEVIYEEMERWYYGYRFTPAPVFTYDPISVLFYLEEETFYLPRSYWVERQTRHPNTVLEAIIEARVLSKSIILNLKSLYTEDNLFCPIENQTFDFMKQRRSFESMLFQNGYLTISEYNPTTDLYTLRIPNMGVLGVYTNAIRFSMQKDDKCLTLHKEAVKSLKRLNIDRFVKTFNIFLKEHSKFNLELNTRAHQELFTFLLQVLLTLDPLSRELTPEWRVFREHYKVPLMKSCRTEEIDFLIETHSYRIIIKCKFETTTADFEKGWEQLRNCDFVNYKSEESRTRVKLLINMNEKGIVWFKGATYNEDGNPVESLSKM